jgi:hypothetical protein
MDYSSCGQRYSGDQQGSSVVSLFEMTKMSLLSLGPKPKKSMLPAQYKSFSIFALINTDFGLK